MAPGLSHSPSNVDNIPRPHQPPICTDAPSFYNPNQFDNLDTPLTARYRQHTGPPNLAATGAGGSQSIQRQYTFGPGRRPKQPHNGSFNARIDGYIERPVVSASGRLATLVWVIHEVKQQKRGPAGPQLRRQEACEYAAWAYETRDELRRELERTHLPVWLLQLSLDKTEFWFQLARVTTEWLDYIGDYTSLVIPNHNAHLTFTTDYI
ncbi:hypothetical protein B0T25DRAFT_298506 [Lasiosphaeria hispida]|uniref:Uncharacterized protein n=1 Tax=Lasiosphaeria hispida TaxID=260671 RepID=A0AAJ0MBI2_9PEZI|nr:hypothetical protein B0T25DRAFT_298506 [Lasiosphaeria hispida]